MNLEWILYFCGAGAAAGAGVASHYTRNLDSDTQKWCLAAGGIFGFGLVKVAFDLIAVVVVIWVAGTVYSKFKPQIDQMTGNFFEGRSQGRMNSNDSEIIDRLKDMGMDDDDIADYFKNR